MESHVSGERRDVVERRRAGAALEWPVLRVVLNVLPGALRRREVRGTEAALEAFFADVLLHVLAERGRLRKRPSTQATRQRSRADVHPHVTAETRRLHVRVQTVAALERLLFAMSSQMTRKISRSSEQLGAYRTSEQIFCPYNRSRRQEWQFRYRIHSLPTR